MLISISNAAPFYLSSGAAADGVDYVSRLKQAEADAHVIDLIRRSLEAHEGRLEAATSGLKDTLGSLEAMQQELLLAQSKAQEVRHERNITRERIKRQEVRWWVVGGSLDGKRSDPGGLLPLTRSLTR